MTIWGKLLSLVFFITLVSNAFALVNSGTGSNECSLLSMDAGIVSLEKSSEKTVYVSIHNSGGEPFYLEKLNTVDDVSGVIVNAYLGDKVILPFESKNFLVQVKTLKDVALGKYFFELQAKGHFLNGDACNLGELKTSLIVEVLEEKQETAELQKTFSCSDFVLSVPNKVVIPKKDGINSVLMDISNGWKERVDIKLTGANLTFYSNFYSIPVNAVMQESVFFSAKKDKTFIVLNMESDSCKFDSKVIEIVKESDMNEFSNQNLEGTQENVQNEEKEEMISLPGLGLVTLTQAGIIVSFVILMIVIATVMVYMMVAQRKTRQKRIIE